MTDSINPFHSIANPRRTTLVSVSSADAAAGAAAPDSGASFTMVGSDDAGACVDGVCALPE